MADVDKPEGEEGQEEAAAGTPTAAAAQAPAAKKAAVKKKAAARKKAAPKKKAATKKKAAPRKKSSPTKTKSEPAMSVKEAPVQLATSKPRGKLWAAVALWGPLLVIWLLVIIASSPDEPTAGAMTETQSME